MRKILLFSVLSTFTAVTACSLTDLDGFTGGAKDGVNSGSSGEGGALTDAPNGGSSDGSSGGEGGSSDANVAEPILVIGGGYPQQFTGPGFDTTYTAVLHADGKLGEWKPGPKLPFGASMEGRVTASNGTVFFVFNDQATSAKRAGDGLTPLAAEPAPTYREDTCAAAMGESLFRIGGKFDNVNRDLVDSKGGPWVATTKLPEPRWLLSCAANASFVYVVAGKNLTDDHQRTVYVAKRNGATLGEWTASNALPNTGYWARPVVVGSRLFVVGGDFDGKEADTVFVATINPTNGAVGEWQQSPASLPVKVSAGSVAAFGNTIVFSGGGDITDGKATKRVFTTSVDATTGALSGWVETTPLPFAMTQHGSAFLP